MILDRVEGIFSYATLRFLVPRLLVILFLFTIIDTYQMLLFLYNEAIQSLQSMEATLQDKLKTQIEEYKLDKENEISKLKSSHKELIDDLKSKITKQSGILTETIEKLAEKERLITTLSSDV